MDVHPLWYICILVRILIVVAIYQTNNYWNHKYVSLILFLMGAGFVYKGYFSSNREVQIAKVFWHDSRYIHGGIYMASAYYLCNKNITMSSILLLSDIFFSILYRVINNI